MDHRKLLPDDCDKCRKQKSCPCSIPRPLPPVQPQLPSVPSHASQLADNENQLLVTAATVMGSLMGAALLLVIFYALVKFHFKRRSQSRRRSLPLFFGTQLDEDRGSAPHIDNPIWYINTIGLQQSVIESITVFKYKRGEGLIEGTDCSVCLNEFQEDESLRLLPKCSHAFHLPCIDTWLRSHKNCPLCRAPIVSEAMDAAQASAASEPNAIASGSRNEPLVENSENYDVTEGGTSELRSRPTEDGNSSESSMKRLDHSKTGSSDSGVPGDEVHQPMRRSVSLDLSSAMEIYSDVARQGIRAHKHRGSLDTELQLMKYPKGKICAKKGNEISSSSISKLMISSSIGRPLSKCPVSMKRSFSSGAKLLFSKRSRSQETILPS